jgi:very-short-patch-repair endonuclease
MTDRFQPDLPRVFIGSSAVNAGLLTVKQLRGPSVVRVLHGVYRPAWVAATHQLACEAACLVLPSDVWVSGPSAATVLGLHLAKDGDDVFCVARESTRVPRRRGVRVRQVRGGPLGGRHVGGIRVADVRRIAFDLAARKDLPHAVAHLDAFAATTGLNLDDFARQLSSWRDNDVCTVRQAVSLTDARSQSIPESVTRVVLVLAGFDVVPQFPVRLNDVVIARVDLALPAYRLAIEYDGAWHALREQFERDRVRLNLLQQAGWRVVHITAAMLRRPQEIVAAVRAAVLTTEQAS